MHIYSLFHAFAVFWMSCVTFWVVLRRVVFNIRRFGTLCLLHLHRRVDAKWEDRNSWCTCLPHHKFLSSHFASTRLWRWNRHSVTKRRLLNTTRRRTIQKVTHDTCTSSWTFNWTYMYNFTVLVVTLSASNICGMKNNQFVRHTWLYSQ
jgi:hypothetical protein